MALIIVLSVLSLGLLGLIVFFFFSKKSSPALKRAALGALIAIGISLGVCGFIVIQGPAAPEAELYLPLVTVADQPAVKGANIPGLLIFLVILAALLGLIIFAGMRDQKKKALDEAIAGFDEPDTDSTL
jgi:flagellar basal body-associated protein FliL